MPKFIDITGKKFSRWNVIKRVSDSRLRQPMFLCKCDCGTKRAVLSVALRNGTSKSCGCFSREVSAKLIGNRRRTHGKSHTVGKGNLYRVWHGIKNRCLNSRVLAFEYYGARGISICDEWKNDFDAFNKWALSNGFKVGLQIDRIDNNGNYEPSNCRFVTVKVNMNNRRKRRTKAELINIKDGREGIPGVCRI